MSELNKSTVIEQLASAGYCVLAKKLKKYPTDQRLKVIKEKLDSDIAIFTTFNELSALMFYEFFKTAFYDDQMKEFIRERPDGTEYFEESFDSFTTDSSTKGLIMAIELKKVYMSLPEKASLEDERISLVGLKSKIFDDLGYCVDPFHIVRFILSLTAESTGSLKLYEMVMRKGLKGLHRANYSTLARMISSFTDTPVLIKECLLRTLAISTVRDMDFEELKKFDFPCR